MGLPRRCAVSGWCRHLGSRLALHPQLVIRTHSELLPSELQHIVQFWFLSCSVQQRPTDALLVDNRDVEHYRWSIRDGIFSTRPNAADEVLPRVRIVSSASHGRPQIATFSLFSSY